MVTALDNPRVEIKVVDVVAHGCVAKKNALEVVAVQFPMPNAQYFNTDTGAIQLQVSDVGLVTVEGVKRSLLGDSMDEPVVQVHRVLQGRGSVLGREPCAIEESPGADGELVIVDLNGTVLGWAIGAGRFQHIFVLAKQKI